MAAAETLSQQGISAEVIDLRSLVPLDWEAIVTSATKTGRVMIVHAAVEFCGFGAEIAAQLQAKLFGQLRAPIVRVGAPYTPVPFARSLESLHFPDAARISSAALAMIKA
jgi:pyruvate/2-oxoglutarate/acetoin dehydrogenase E1 component